MERTTWWYVLAGIAALNVAWSVVGVLSGERITLGPAPLWLVFGGSFLVLTPLFYVALYRDATAVRARDDSWRPRWRLWIGGGGLLSAVGAVAFLNPFTHYVAALYLIRRAQRTGASQPA